MINFRHILTVTVLAVAMAGCSKSSSSGSSQTPAPGDGKVTVNANLKAPSAIPAITDGTPASPDRQTLDQTLARAAKENKSVIIEMGAAWCGPCTNMAMDLEAHPEYLKELYANGYILVKAEFERTMTADSIDFSDLTDYMPTFISLFPSYFLYTPGKGWKAIGTYNSYALLKTALATPKLSDVMTLDEIKACVQADTNCSAGDQARLGQIAAGNPAGEYTYSEFKAIIAYLNSQDSAHPTLYLADTASQIAGFAGMYFGIGAVDIDTLAKDFPTTAVNYTDASQDNYNYRPLHYRIGNLLRTQGLKKTAAQCADIVASYKSTIKPGKLSDADFQTKMAHYDLEGQILCTNLEVRDQGVTEQTKADYAKIDPTKLDDWSLAQMMNDTPKAVSIWNANYQQFVQNYQSDIDSTNDDLKDAQAKNDQQRIQQDQQSIALVSYMQKYHASIDTEVQGDFKDNKPVTVLRVEN